MLKQKHFEMAEFQNIKISKSSHPVVQKDGVLERLLCKRLGSVCGSMLRSPFCLEACLNQSLTAAAG